MDLFGFFCAQFYEWVAFACINIYGITFNEQILTAAKTLHCSQMLPLDLYTDIVFFFFWIIYEHARKKKKELALEVNKSPYARSTISREKIEGLWKSWLPLFIEFFLTTPVLQASLSNWSFYNKLLRAVHCQWTEKAKLAPSYRKLISLYSNLRYFNIIPSLLQRYIKTELDHTCNLLAKLRNCKRTSSKMMWDCFVECQRYHCFVLVLLGWWQVCTNCQLCWSKKSSLA